MDAGRSNDNVSGNGGSNDSNDSNGGSNGDSNIVLSCYLTSRPDPQRECRWKPDDDCVVETWAESLAKCGLNGIIFHDELSERFTTRWRQQTGGHVSFERIGWQTPWTAAEERVMVYRNWLCTRRGFQCERVLMTDLSDVEFYYDPFPLMNDPVKLYTGIEQWRIGRCCLMSWSMRTYGEVAFADQRVLNPGIVGGARATVLPLLRSWLDEMDRAIKPTIPPHDIVAFNRVCYRDEIPLVTGSPLHTRFKGFEGRESNCAIRHK